MRLVTRNKKSEMEVEIRNGHIFHRLQREMQCRAIIKSTVIKVDSTAKSLVLPQQRDRLNESSTKTIERVYFA